MRILTIGFTRKSAERFFEMLRTAGAKRVVDVRLNNVSQLAGFAKKNLITTQAKRNLSSRSGIGGVLSAT